MPYVNHQPMSGITDVLSATNAIVTDPCLDRVATLVLRLHAAEQRGQAPARPGQPPAPPKPPTKGIGLCSAVKPLEAVVWVRERPWVVPVGAAAVVVGLFALGYASGRRRRSA